MRLMTVLAAVLLPLFQTVLCQAQVKSYRAETVESYPHDVTSYTQGLFFYGAEMYESTGLNGKSTFRKVDMATGRPLRKLDFDSRYFVEGSVVLDDILYILTWHNKVVFTYSMPDLTYRSTCSYPREGWGLTTDGRQLIASDGSSYLYFLTPDLKTVRKVNVTLQGRPMRFLNELEYIGGKIWANVYTSDLILVIDPETGKVEATVDCSGILPDRLRTPDTDVLNGIAYDSEEDRIYITGKNWPELYEIRLVEKK